MKKLLIFINKIKKIDIDDLCGYSVIIFSALLALCLGLQSQIPFGNFIFFRRCLAVFGFAIFVICFFTSDYQWFISFAIFLPVIVTIAFFVAYFLVYGVFLYPYDAYFH